MSSDMRSWKTLASTAGNRFKDYVAQKDPRVSGQQTWKEWAGEKISSRRNQGGGIEQITIFPGWAARKYATATAAADAPFDLDVFISGYASAYRPPELASRSQRAFLKLAKSFAGLPKLEAEGLSVSTEDLLKSVQMPPRPTEISEEFEIEALEKQFQQLNAMDDSRPPSPPQRSLPLGRIPEDIRRLHANLESRLNPFWASGLPTRIVAVHLYSQPEMTGGPIASTRVTTTPDGSFQVRFTIPWQHMCLHPGALHIAFDEFRREHELLAEVQLLPSPFTQIPTPVTASAKIPLTHSPIRVISDIDDTVKRSDVIGGARAVFYNVFVRELEDLVIPGMGEWYARMWNRGVRFHYVSNGPFGLLPVLGNFLPLAKLPPGSMKLRSYAGRSLFSGLLSAPAIRKRANVEEVLNAFPHSRFILVGDTGEQDMELYADFAAQRPEQILAVFIRLVQDGCPKDLTGANFEHPNSPQRSAPPTYAPYEPIKRRTTSSSIASTKSMPVWGSMPMTNEPDLIDFSDDLPLSKPPPPPPPPRKPTLECYNPAPSNAVQTTYSNGSGKMTEEEKLQQRIWNARAKIPSNVIFRVFRDPKECIRETDDFFK